MTPTKLAAVALAVALALPALAHARKGTLGKRSGRPADALEAPRHLGFTEVAFSRSMDRHGRPISRLVVSESPDAVYQRLKKLYDRSTSFGKGWSIQGLAHSSTGSGSVSITLDSPSGVRYSVWGKPDASGRMVLTLEGKPHIDHAGRMSAPVGDRKVR